MQRFHVRCSWQCLRLQVLWAALVPELRVRSRQRCADPGDRTDHWHRIDATATQRRQHISFMCRPRAPLPGTGCVTGVRRIVTFFGPLQAFCRQQCSRGLPRSACWHQQGCRSAVAIRRKGFWFSKPEFSRLDRFVGNRRAGVTINPSKGMTVEHPSTGCIPFKGHRLCQADAMGMENIRVFPLSPFGQRNGSRASYPSSLRPSASSANFPIRHRKC